MKVEIFGISTCDSCRKAKKWLEAQGHDYRFQDLRDVPPSRSQVAAWVKALTTKALRNTSGGSYRALPDEKKAWDDSQWLAHFVDDPMLIKRPVLVIDGKPAAVGFKEARYQELL